VWEQLGIAEAMKARLTFANALDGGVAAITNGEAEIGLFPMSEIIHEKGVTLVGLIPQAVQLNVFYGAAVLAANPAPEPAAAFVKFLADPKHADVWQHAGFTPAK
jgi:molybdate transport system substrate-binding protein